MAASHGSVVIGFQSRHIRSDEATAPREAAR